MRGGHGARFILMKKSIFEFVRRHVTALVASSGALTIVLILGLSGSCPLCASLTGAVGLPSFASTARAAEPVATGRSMAPGWTLQDLDGKAVNSSDFAGKVVILDFWATWCPPCRAELPSLIALQKKYGDQGLVIIGVSLDQKGPSVVIPFAREHGINFPLVMGDEAIMEAFGGIEAIPTTFVIDREGRLVSRHVGVTSQAEFEAEIEPLL